MKEMTRVLIKGHLADLYEGFNNYPKEILDYDYKYNLLDSAVFDVDHGLILEIGERKVVISALRGFKNLTLDQIKAIYGDPPTLSKLKWPQTNKVISRSKNESFWIL